MLLSKELKPDKKYYLIRFNYVLYSIDLILLDALVADNLYKYYVSHGTTKRVNLKLNEYTGKYTPVMYMKNRSMHTQLLFSENDMIELLAFYSKEKIKHMFEGLIKNSNNL